MVARRRFGQHFLHDPAIIGRIVAAIDPRPGDELIEIGPGRGALTGPLIARTGRLEAIEIDRDLAHRLALEYGAALIVHQADALTIDFAALAAGRKLRVCGNLPYNISTPILFRLLESTAHILDLHFMLQREVVERMAASPGSRKYGRLTVMLAARCRVEKLFTVGAGAFQPPPKVESALVRLVPYVQAPFYIAAPQRFARVVAAAFEQRRKTLRNALAGYVDRAGFLAAGVDPGRRAETVSAEEFARLAQTPGPAPGL
jgi:16S rRNA (adenine1518-N6/adenine1519-N6)-dimethyltransferase